MLRPHQITGAEFLADRSRALLADGMRVGKTGAAIHACDLVGADHVLWLTMGAARQDHARAWQFFQQRNRFVSVLEKGKDRLPPSGTIITSYSLAAGAFRQQFRDIIWDAIVLDEAHRLSNIKAQRTEAIFGYQASLEEKTYRYRGRERFVPGGILEDAEYGWALSGTPVPNNYSEIYTLIRAFRPDLIMGKNGKPLSFYQFKQKYCKIKKTGFGEMIVGNKNSADLKRRLQEFTLRRTIDDVAKDMPETQIDVLPLDCTGYLKELKDLEREEAIRALDGELDRASDVLKAAILEEIDASVKRKIQRLTGLAKAPSVVKWVEEQFADGMPKIVLFAWHKDVIRTLADGLKEHNPVVIDGSTSAKGKTKAQDEFQTNPKIRVVIGQLESAGEAIDLSAADEALFVEASWIPGQNDQAAKRIFNIQKKRPTLARFAMIPGSIDERIQKVNAQKTQDIARLF